MAKTTLIDPPGAGDAQPAKPSLLKRLARPRILIVCIAIVLILAAAGAGVWLFFFKGSNGADQPAAPEAAAKDAAQGPAEPEFEDVVILDPFDRMKLKPSQAMGYLNLTVALELVDPGMKSRILDQDERIRQVVEFEVGNMSWMDLRNPDGKLKLKFRLINSINALMPETTVRNVYFTQFLMQ